MDFYQWNIKLYYEIKCKLLLHTYSYTKKKQKKIYVKHNFEADYLGSFRINIQINWYHKQKSN